MAIKTELPRYTAVKIQPNNMTVYDQIAGEFSDIVGQNVLRKISRERPVNILWVAVPIEQIQYGIYIPLLAIAKLLKIGCEVTIMIDDLHAMLVDNKMTERQLKNRCDYYHKVIKIILETLDVDLSAVNIVNGSNHQLNKEYIIDMYSISGTVKGSRQKIGTLLYPIFRALDEEYLNCDAQIGYCTEKNLYKFFRASLPKVGYKKRVHLFLDPLEDLSINVIDSRSYIRVKLSEINPTLTALTSALVAYKYNRTAEEADLLDDINAFIEPIRKKLSTREWGQILKHAYE